jgi:voltage-gated potassium channel
VALLWAIICSIMVVMLESVSSIQARFGPVLRTLEWFLPYRHSYVPD